MATTNDIDLFNKMSMLRTHGIIKDKTKLEERPSNEIWNYQQLELGYNYRMNDIQGALGISQMKRLDKYTMLRNEISKFYNYELKHLPLTTPWQLPNVYSSFHLYPVLIKDNLSKKSQKEIYEKLIENRISVNLHYIPVHRHPYYEKLGFKK